MEKKEILNKIIEIYNELKDREKSRTYMIKYMNYHIIYEANRDIKSVSMIELY